MNIFSLNYTRVFLYTKPLPDFVIPYDKVLKEEFQGKKLPTF